MSLAMITDIRNSVTIPVMAKARFGHFVQAQILEALQIDYIDESEVLTPADEECHIDKSTVAIPFVCGARNLAKPCAGSHASLLCLNQLTEELALSFLYSEGVIDAIEDVADTSYNERLARRL